MAAAIDEGVARAILQPDVNDEEPRKREQTREPPTGEDLLISVATRLKAAGDDARARVVDVFRSMDADGSGVLSRKELRSGLGQLGVKLKRGEAKQVFELIDTDGSGGVALEELCKALRLADPNAPADANEAVDAAKRRVREQRRRERDERLKKAAQEAQRQRVIEAKKKRVAEEAKRRLVRRAKANEPVALSPEDISQNGEARESSSEAGLDSEGLQELFRVSAKLRELCDRNHSRLVDVFRQMDTSGDGHISLEELGAGLASLGLMLSPDEIGSLFSVFDVDCSGTVEYKEMFRALQDSDLTRAAHKSARAKRQEAIAAKLAGNDSHDGGNCAADGAGELMRQRAEAAALSLADPTERDCPLFFADGRVDRRESSKAVELVVGGQVFRAMPELFLRYPDSLLGRVFTGRHPHVRPNRHGRYFFDRDPRHFEPILTYYRTGQLVVPPTVAVQGVMAEARFFGMEARMFGRTPVAAARFRKSIERDLTPDGPPAVFFVRGNEKLIVGGVSLVRQHGHAHAESWDHARHRLLLTMDARDARNSPRVAGGVVFDTLAAFHLIAERRAVFVAASSRSSSAVGPVSPGTAPKIYQREDEVVVSEVTLQPPLPEEPPVVKSSHRGGHHCKSGDTSHVASDTERSTVSTGLLGVSSTVPQPPEMLPGDHRYDFHCIAVPAMAGGGHFLRVRFELICDFDGSELVGLHSSSGPNAPTAVWASDAVAHRLETTERFQRHRRLRKLRHDHLQVGRGENVDGKRLQPVNGRLGGANAVSKRSAVLQRLSPKFVAETRALLHSNYATVMSIFRTLDRNGNGRVSESELRDGMRKLNVSSTADELGALFDAMDFDNSGEIQYRELLTFLRALEQTANAQLPAPAHAPTVSPPPAVAILKHPRGGSRPGPLSRITG